MTASVRESLARYGLLAREARSASPLLSAVLVVATVLSAAVYPGLALILGTLVGDVAGMTSGRTPSLSPLLIIGMTTIFFVMMTAQTCMTLVADALADRVDLRLQRRLMAATVAPSTVDHLNRQDVRAAVESAAWATGEHWQRPSNAIRDLPMVWSGRLAAVGSAAIVTSWHWAAGVAVLVIALLAGAEARRTTHRVGQHLFGQTDTFRRSQYFADVAIEPPAGKETRIFGLGRYFLDKYDEHWNQAMEGFAGTARAGQLRLRVSLAVSVVVVAVILCLLGYAAAGGDVSPGGAARAMQAIFATFTVLVVGGFVHAVFAQYSLSAIDKHEAGVRVATEAAAVEAGRDGPAGGLPTRSISMSELRYSYPGQEREVLAGLDLEIPAGQSLAIVGANGAGKTTLIKLLSGLITPTHGRIQVDGVDLASIDPASWHRQVAVIFQNYLQYDLSVRENIGFGSLDDMHDSELLARAAASAGATELIAGLPHGWDTVLSPAYVDGTGLSGGQWQRIGLARALFAAAAGAKILILDEPTANLDVRAEAEIYRSFLKMTAGLTTIVISHRFSTVRQADLIAVVDQGRVAEKGTHASLMEAGGLYAEMFELQSARFRDRTEDDR